MATFKATYQTMEQRMSNLKAANNLPSMPSAPTHAVTLKNISDFHPALQDDDDSSDSEYELSEEDFEDLPKARAKRKTPVKRAPAKKQRKKSTNEKVIRRTNQRRTTKQCADQIMQFLLDSFDAVNCPSTETQTHAFNEIERFLKDANVSAVFKLLEERSSHLAEQLVTNETNVALQASKDPITEGRVDGFCNEYGKCSGIELLQMEKDLEFQLQMVKCLQARQSPDLVAIDFATGALSNIMTKACVRQSSVHHNFIFNNAIQEAEVIPMAQVEQHPTETYMTFENGTTGMAPAHMDELASLQAEVNQSNHNVRVMQEQIRQYEQREEEALRQALADSQVQN